MDVWGKRAFAGQNGKVFKTSFGSKGESRNSAETKPRLLSALTELRLRDEGAVVPLQAGSARRRARLGGLHRPPRGFH